MFFLALLSLAKALDFSHCNFPTLAEAAEILAFIAMGLAGNAYMWSVACPLLLSSGSLFIWQRFMKNVCVCVCVYTISEKDKYSRQVEVHHEVGPLPGFLLLFLKWLWFLFVTAKINTYKNIFSVLMRSNT